MRVGLLGCGSWGRNYLQFRPNVYDDPTECNLTEWLNIQDAVIIATPSAKHAEHALRAVEAGCHVLVEKPMALTLSEAEAIVSERVVMVGHIVLFSDAYRFAKTVEPRFMHSVRHSNNIRPKPDTAVTTLAPHDLAISYDLFGTCSVISHETERDRSIMRLEHGTVDVDWDDPNRLRRLTLVGDEVAVMTGESVTIAGETRDFDATAPLRNEYEHFISCCKGEAEPLSGRELGLAVTSALEGVTLRG